MLLLDGDGISAFNGVDIMLACAEYVQERPVHQLDTHPIDPTVLLASGDGFLRMFRLVEDALKPLVVRLLFLLWRRGPNSTDSHRRYPILRIL